MGAPLITEARRNNTEYSHLEGNILETFNKIWPYFDLNSPQASLNCAAAILAHASIQRCNQQTGTK